MNNLGIPNVEYCKQAFKAISSFKIRAILKQIYFTQSWEGSTRNIFVGNLLPTFP